MLLCLTYLSILWCLTYQSFYIFYLSHLFFFFLFLRLLSIYRYSIVTLSWLFTITCVCVVSLGFMCPSWHSHCSCFSGCLSLPGLPKTVENDIATELEIASPRMLCWHGLLQGEVRQGLVATNNLVQL